MALILGIADFRRQIRQRQSGCLVVAFLATFRPTGEYFGIDGINELARQAGELVGKLAPASAHVGLVNWLTSGVLLPDGIEEARTLAGRIKQSAKEDDIELEPGEWAEIRFATGCAQINRHDGESALRAAVDEATHDLRRNYPSEWHYPIVIPDVDDDAMR